MDNCPLCSGETITRISSAGEETFCSSCRNILKSATLNFEFKMAGAGAEACSANGLPGWKGPGAEAKCYTFTPGNTEQETKAQQKANQSAYMEEKRAHTAKLVTADPIWNAYPLKIVEGEETAEELPEHKASSPLERIIPSTTKTEDDVEVNSNQDVGSGVTQLASSNFHPSFFNTHEIENGLGRGYCTNCGGNHEAGIPCI